MIDIKLQKTIQEMIEYMEDTEVTIDGEWGSCRTLCEIISDGDMPDLYSSLLLKIESINNGE